MEIALFPGQDLAPLLANLDTNYRKKVAQFKDLLEKMLVVDPEKRILPSDALKHPFIAEPCVD